MSRQFNWDDLKIFLAVARSGTISLAGRQLHINHATVARRIAALEDALHLKLFYRTAKGYALTDHGQALMEGATRIELTAFQVERELTGPDQLVSGLVKLVCPESLANFFLASRITALVSQNRQLAIELISIQQLSIARHQFDIAVTLAPMTDNRFVCERLVDYKLYVYASPAYLEKSGPITRRDDLIGHPFVGHIDDLILSRTANYLDGITKGVAARLQSTSIHGKVEAVAAGFGLCVLPGFVAATRDDLVPILTDAAFLERSYWLVIRSDLIESPRIRSTAAFLRKTVGAESGLFQAF